MSDSEKTDEHKRQRRQIQNEKLEALATLAGDVAHDFNNFLAPIFIYAEMLESRLASSPDLKKVQKILKCAVRAKSLTDSLLAVGKKQPLQPNPLNLNQICLEFDTQLREKLPPNIDFNIQLSDDNLIIHGDSRHLKNVVNRLLENAEEAMPQGGRLEIRTTRKTFDKTEASDLGVRSHTPYACLHILDSGNGMDEETQIRLFEPFYTTKKDVKGAGLGMSIAHGVVIQHGGQIHVRSQPENGSEITLYFPLSAENITQEPTRILESRQSKPSAKKDWKETILLVDDDPDVRASAAEILVHHGYRILEAASGEQALNIFKTHKDTIDLLLTDLVMPQMNGRELAKKIQQIAPPIKILFMTGYMENNNEVSSLFPSEDHLLRKPFRFAEAEKKIRSLLD